MSESVLASKKFLDRVKTNATQIVLGGTALAIFFVLLLAISLLNQFHSGLANERAILIEKRIQMDKACSELQGELQVTLKNGLLFSLSNKEIDRFQAVYSLKTTKEKFDKVSLIASEMAIDDELLQDVQTAISSFDLQVAANLNSDGRFAEIMQGTLSDLDTLASTLLPDEARLDVSSVSMAQVDKASAEVQRQLMALRQSYYGAIEAQELELQAASPRLIYLITLLVILIIMWVAASIIQRSKHKSINQLSKVVQQIAKGELPENGMSEAGELRKIAGASKELVTYLDDARKFATKIGGGDFEYQFDPKSESDALGNSLVEMRDRLQQVAHEDHIRNWINEGQAKFGEILRQHSDDIETLGDRVVLEMVEYIGASQGGLFVYKEDDEAGHLELLSSYAFQRQKFVEKRIEIGEGLAGQAFEEGKRIYITDVKSDHFDIQTGLGISKPSSILIVPLKQEENIEGIIELASLKELEKHQIEFVETIGESIASSLSSGKVNQTTKKLLQETQEKAEEMKAQEEELRQNMEELAATQEQMARRNQEMEEVQKQLTEERYLLNALLGSTHDQIYFKDLDSKYLRVSSAVVNLFKKKDEQEVLGNSDYDFGYEDHAKVAFEAEQKIIKTGKALNGVVEKQVWDDGSVTWVSTTKNPLKDLDGKTVGTFGISRDITKSKEVEIELQKRKEWFDNFFNFHKKSFLILNESGEVSFASKAFLENFKKGKSTKLHFNDVIANKQFSDFLEDIDFSKTRDKEFILKLTPKNNKEGTISFLAVAASEVNEDGSENIFLIEQ